jgi:hypothetical protein
LTRHRLYVWPWLRRIGAAVLPDWLAISIGPRIFAWRELTAPELEHELEHVRQWMRYGVAFPLVYLAESLRVARAGKRWYLDNRYERAARDAAGRIR